MGKARTFGWIQDASNLGSLCDVVAALLPGTAQNAAVLRRVERFVPNEALRESLCALLVSGGPYPYALLKGTGAGCQLTEQQNEELLGRTPEEARRIAHRGGRGNAACSGITQASLTAQDGRPYQSDWAAESYLRLAVTLGLLTYDGERDEVRVSAAGVTVAQGGAAEVRRTMTAVLLTYPPAVRILELLGEGPATKFELGGRLGFQEAGFTSVDQGLFLAYCAACPPGERAGARNNFEGTADKYARMICSLLQQLGLVEAAPCDRQEVYGGRIYTMALTRYSLTALGVKQLRDCKGNSRHRRPPKSVPYTMLATKAPDRMFLRFRRAQLLRCLSGGRERTLAQMQAFLAEEQVRASEQTLQDDLEGLRRMGLEIVCRGGAYRLADQVINLTIPESRVAKPEISERKERLRGQLERVDHRYLQLIDLGVSGGRQGKDRDYEIVTAELLGRELGLGGLHLGGANRPDVIASWGRFGLIVDNKAYEAGFTISAHQKDEMVRYIDDNRFRDARRNPNCWWEQFPEEADTFFFLYVSSGFRGEYQRALADIAYRTGTHGAAITSENLLLLAERLKEGTLTTDDLPALFRDEEIRF